MTVNEYLSLTALENPFKILDVFENKLANFFGSRYAVVVDCCTHAIELCLRLTPGPLTIPKYTYVSVPMTAIKLNIDFNFDDREWVDYYSLKENIYDAAVLWRRNSYISGSMMCISFQHKKHLNLGRGGCILLDDFDQYQLLKKMSYDGRNLDLKHTTDNISTIGYHYYMTPEIALQGIEIFESKQNIPSRIWTNRDYADLSKLDVFKNYV